MLTKLVAEGERLIFDTLSYAKLILPVYRNVVVNFHTVGLKFPNACKTLHASSSCQIGLCAVLNLVENSYLLFYSKATQIYHSLTHVLFTILQLLIQHFTYMYVKTC